MHPGAAELRERSQERDAIRRALVRAASGAGAVVVFRGDAGLGKSTMLGIAADLARTEAGTSSVVFPTAPGSAVKNVDRVGHVLAARGSALESSIPFGLARKLVTPLVRDAETRDRVLVGDAALATPLLGGEWARWAADDVAVGVQEGLCALIANAALGGAPLVLLLDDLQWADRPTLRFLLALVARIDALPVAIVCARRPERMDAGAADLLDALEADPSVALHQLVPLSTEAAGDVVCAALGADVPADLVSACVEVSGGNPFYLRELLRELHDAGKEMPSPAAVAATVPASVTRSVAVRLARLPDAATALASALAVLGDDTELRTVARLAELDERAAESACDALAGAAIIEPGDPLRFVHSLVGSAVYDDIAPFTRSGAHGRAARILMADGAASERAAAHLLLARPQDDDDAVQVLRDAAALAQTRGEPDVAVQLLERALAENPSDTVRSALLVQLAGADILRGAAGAGARLEQALTLLEDPSLQAATLRAHAAVLHHRGDFAGAAAACERGLALVAPGDPLADELLAGFIGAGMLWPPLIERARGDLQALLESHPRPSRPPALCAQLAIHAADRGEADEFVRTIAEQAFVDDPLVDSQSLGISLGYAAQALIWVDALDSAERHLDAAADAARRRAAFIPLSVARLNQATVAYHQGRLDDAVGHADRALDVVRHGWTDSTWSTPVLALAHVELGDLTAARAALALGERANPMRSDQAMLLEARAAVALAEGDPAAALADAAAAGVIAAEFGSTCARLFRWRTVAALAAHRSGRPDDAADLIGPALEDARSLATPRQLGQTLTVAGLIATGSAGLGLHDEAVAVLEGSPSRLQFAHSLLELGAARRRQGERTAAREPLTRAFELAHSFSAVPLVERARQELHLLGIRPRRGAQSGPAALTAGERRVAELAADGLSNLQIAQRLFIARKTVESHLASTFRKLGVSARGDLRSALDGAPPR